MKTISKIGFAALLASAVLSFKAEASSLGGNSSLSATTTSSNVQLTAQAPYTAAVIAPAVGTTTEVFYAIGGSSVAATTSSAALPSGGICVLLGGKGTAQGVDQYVAAITASGSATVRITQFAGQCPIFAGAGGGGGGGGGSVTQGTTPWIVAGQGTAGTPATGVVTVQGITGGVAQNVSQATASNLNATVVGTGTFAVQSTDNITQFGGTNISTGVGASGAGIPRFTLSNDSIIKGSGAAAITQSLSTNILSQYPVNSVTTTPTPVGAVAAGTTAAVAATFAATASVTNFLCEFDVSIIGSTTAGTVTIAGLNGGSRIYNFTAVAAGTFLSKSFSPCIPASAANTAITITTSAFSGATANNVNSSGYRL